MRYFLLPTLVGALLLAGGAGGRVQTPSGFAGHVAALSEPAGYFDTDNLISNERSYLEVLPDLKRLGVKGGAYIGVGPDQNFSYIAAVRPDIAFIVDIRHDNMLLHLLFKALFAMSSTRVEYVSLLLGRPVPPDLDRWRDATIDRLVSYVEGAALNDRGISLLRTRVDAAIARAGVSLSREDLTTIDRFHRRFIEAGASLRFQSLGRPPQMNYPSYRDLLLAEDPNGQRGNYLATEEAFQFIKGLQQRDLVIPVVGDLSGPKALAAIAALLNRRGQRLTALYASNVEFYLFGDPRFSRYVANLSKLPRSEHSVVIRSIFGRYAWPGGGSISRVQEVSDLVDGFAKGRFAYYENLIGGR
jgi:hypothetical protein